MLQQGLMSAFDAMLNGESFFQAFGNMLKSMIKQLVVAAATALILSTILGGLGFGTMGGKATDFKSMFGQLSGLGLGGGGEMPFANGGIVSGPVNALVGEYPGAKSNPEVIAPLNKLKNIMGEQGGGGNMNVSGEFVVRGQDLVVALQRADKTRSRIK
jgi:hypothetical protein